MAGKPLKEFGRYGTVGIELILSILIGLFAGRYADTHFNTAPWLMVAGVVVGMYAGFRQLFATAGRMRRDMERADASEKSIAAKQREVDLALRKLDEMPEPTVEKKKRDDT